MHLKLLRIMKLTAIILLSACLAASASGHTQTVTLAEKNAPLVNVLEAIKTQTGYNFLYTETQLNQANKVTIKVNKVSLEEALQICFSGQPFSYSIIDKTIVVKSSETPVRQSGDQYLPLPIDIKGRVTNESGDPVPASIVVKGTNIGTTTNTDGYFELKNVDDNATLVVTGVSIEKREIKVNGKTDISIIVKQKVTEGEEVLINAGYYDVRKKELTGNISRVSASIIEKQPVSNPLQALQGRVAGLQITQQSGVAGGGMSVQIRGLNSLRNGSTENGNLPLFIVDGVPFTSAPLGSLPVNILITRGGNPLNSINPSDIESIEILKDADATSIYGALGANGVVLITTKKAKEGKTKGEVNFFSGIGKVASRMDLLTTKQYVEMRNEALLNDGVPAGSINSDYDLLAWDTTRYTDWQERMIGGTASILNAQASASGGQKNTNFLLSTGYYKEGSVFPGDFSYQKGSAHFSLNHFSENQKFNASFLTSYVVDNNIQPNIDGTLQALLVPPNAPEIYDANGNLNWEGGTFYNHYAVFLRKYQARNSNLVSNLLVRYKINSDLELKSSFGYTRMSLKELSTFPNKAYSPFSPSNSYSIFGDDMISTWTIEPQAEYKKKLGKGVISALIGTTFRASVTEREVINATGFSSDAFIENSKAAATVTVQEYVYKQYRYQALFGRVNLNWDNRFLLNLTARRDGSSRFGPGKQFGNFGAVGAGWILSNENFVKAKLPFLSFAKLRTSYGTSGNDQIGDYKYLDTYNPVFYPYAGSPGIQPSRLANPNYGWELNRKFEASLELGLFANRILFSSSYYRNRSSNQLVSLATPLITGFASIQDNLKATIQNSGLELELATTNIDINEFKWNTSINITFPKNKLVSYPNFEGSQYANLYEIGQPLTIVKLYHYTGVDPQTGIYTFQDVNNDGNISWPQDILPKKSLTQTFYGGLQNSFQFKGWQLDVFFQFVKQTGYNHLFNPYSSPPGLYGNLPAAIMDRWRKPGDVATVQKFSQDYGTAFESGYNYTVFGDDVIGNASFVRFKNLSLSYNLPERWSQNLRIKGCRLYIQGQNLVTFTRYKGLDPETQSLSSIPPLRIMTGGFQITF